MGSRKNIINAASMIILVLFIIFTAFSLMAGFHDSLVKGDKCEVQSIIELVNLPYRAACEVGKHRWN